MFSGIQEPLPTDEVCRKHPTVVILSCRFHLRCGVPILCFLRPVDVEGGGCEWRLLASEKMGVDRYPGGATEGSWQGGGVENEEAVNQCPGQAAEFLS